ncbi:CO(2)-response secreted protease-like isoform X1 [Carya illinoinensis]|uniref:CO(2)-response secreted protease-like isoform X1 n=1 Tax=Carya illinoinensis TaxID=32201 RepID=UPI001C717C12|nr:CO(2)-response secreted protease-like isoform X1 [Carya illinoinensis]
MASLLQLLHLIFSISFLLTCRIATSNRTPKPYVVYMGSTSSSNNEGSEVQVAESAYMQLLSSIIPSEDQNERRSLTHHYDYAFKGFSAMLTENEASILSAAGHPDIVSVFPDSVLQLHTTRSWDFLETERRILRASATYNKHVSSDVIIGMIDTGIWPECPSFNDKGIGEIPSRWKGVCIEGPDFKLSNCNRKLIGARYYPTPEMNSIHGSKMSPAAGKTSSGSPRDYVDHGTHTASTAGGFPVVNASYYGLAGGTARGGLPSARIASYKACSKVGCSSSSLLKAFDDALKDGVDIISVSIGVNFFLSNYKNDPIAIGAFHAENMGVMVACSGGNDGPFPDTIKNTAPWIFTVAASSIDRDFRSTIQLGNGKTFRGSAINLSNLTKTRTYPLVFGKDVASNFTPTNEASNCRPGSLDPEKAAGKIVVCVDNDPTMSRIIKKLVVEDMEAIGMIFISEAEKDVPFDSGTFPFVQVGSVEGLQILHYINSTKDPRATILPTVEIPRYKPAPVVAYFSSRGPARLAENILKPDIMAPGVAILAGTIPHTDEPGSVPVGKKPSQFAIRSGTSMSCPHVTGAASLIKSVHPGWSPSMIKSALMTTATVHDNMGKPLTKGSGNPANPHEMGAGEISPLKALHPGLVFETTATDYLRFLCYYGYSERDIRSISNTNFSCPSNSIKDLISDINYPSISIANLSRNQTAAKTIQRTVTNVGLSNATYIAKVYAPVGLVVDVFPHKLVFLKGVTKLSYNVSFFGKEASSGYNFGSLTWFDGRHSVRTVFTVKVQ